MPGQVRGAGITYVTVSKGKLVVRQPDGTKAYYDSWSEANLVGMKRIHDEKYDRDKWCLTLKELNGDTVILQFTDETWYSVGFFARILNCRLDLPMEIGVLGPKEDAGKLPDDESRSKTSFCYIRQEGTAVKKDDAFPKATKITLNRKQVDDYTLVTKRVDEIFEILKSKGVRDTSGDHKLPQRHYENDKTPTQVQSPPPSDDYPIPDDEPAF